MNYNYYRIHNTVSVEQTDNSTLKLVVNFFDGEGHFYYPSVTVNLSGITTENIASIESNDEVTGLSYANHGDGIMLNIDCRKYLAEHAEHFVEQYEANKSDASAKADALYFVNMLKESDKKKQLMERIQKE